MDNIKVLLPSSRIDLVKLRQLYSQKCDDVLSKELTDLEVVEAALNMGLLSNRQARRTKAELRKKFRLTQFKALKARRKAKARPERSNGLKAGIGNWSPLHKKGTKGGAKKMQQDLQSGEYYAKVGIDHSESLLLKTI